MPHYYERFTQKYTFVLAGESDTPKAIESKPMVKSFFINFLAKEVLSEKELEFANFVKQKKGLN